MRTLADPLPLRTTAEWPGFREAVALPVRIGLTRGKLIQYSQDRTQWVWAGHACASIDVVSVGGLPAQDWTSANVLDAAGKPVAMVTFSSPIDEGVELTAQGRGWQDQATGALVQNPAAALIAILSDVGGIPVNAEQLAPFRADCDRNGLVIGGSIETADTAQTVARALCASIGAKFGSAARDLSFLWPSDAGTVRAVIGDSSGSQQVTLKLDCALSDFCNDLTVQYDFDGGQPRGSIRLVAPAQIARYGSFPQTLAATWVTAAGVAQAVGARLLAHSARKQWLATASNIKRTDLRIGDFVSFAHSLLSDSGAYPILSRETDLETCTITARIPIGPAPSVAIASQSSYFDPNAYVSLEFETQGDDRNFTIRDTDGVTPLSGAAVQILPSGPTHQTNASGIVTFTTTEMPSGFHYELGCATADGRYFTFGVDV